MTVPTCFRMVTDARSVLYYPVTSALNDMPFAVKAFWTHPYLPHIRRCRLSLSIRRFQRALFLLTSSPSLPHNSGSSLESKVVLLYKRECICICCTLSSHGFEWCDVSTCPLCRSCYHLHPSAHRCSIWRIKRITYNIQNVL